MKNELEPHKLISIDTPENKLPIDLARISINNQGEPLTWGATPLVASSDVKIQQDAVKAELDSLFDAENVPTYISESLAEYIYVLNMSRTVNRESHNQDSYAYREKMDLDGIPFETLEVFNRAIRGFASPAELLFIQELMGIPTIELASLTHPYKQRIELLKHMRPAINQAIELMGGVLVRSTHPVFEVKGSDNPHQPAYIEGIHMTRKTIFGYIDGKTEIVERSSFVVLLDHIPTKVAQAIRALPFENNEAWNTQVNELLSAIVPSLLENDEFDKAVPVSTTVVAINSELEQKLLSKEAMRTRQRQYMFSHASKI